MKTTNNTNRRNCEKLYESFGAIDEDILSRSEKAEGRKNRNGWVKWGVTAACLCLIAAAAIAAVSLRNKGIGQGWPVKPVDSGYRPSTGEIAVIPPWEEMPVSRQFGEVEFGGSRYSSRVTGISAEYVASELGKAALRGEDVYTDTVHETTAAVFEISGVSTDCAIALRFEGQETDPAYYVYVNSWYQPQTLGQLIGDLRLRDTLSFGSVWYEYRKTSGDYATVEFTGLEQEAIWEHLLSDTAVPAVADYDSRQFRTVISVSVNIPLLGYENISMAVTEDGYLTTNILDTGKAFFLGKEKTKRFVDYVLEHGEGRERRAGAGTGGVKNGMAVKSHPVFPSTETWFPVRSTAAGYPPARIRGASLPARWKPAPRQYGLFEGRTCTAGTARFPRRW